MKSTRVGFLIWRYATFFLLICFVVTSSFMLFLNSMQLDTEMIRDHALITFGNIILLSCFCCLCELVLRKLTVNRAIREIREATHRMASGDFSARIDTKRLLVFSDDFNSIAEDFNLMADELSTNATLRTDFLANVSHEMKTPLSIIRNDAKLLSQDSVTPNQRILYAQSIDKATQRMTGLITNVLKLNKLENQQIVPVQSEYDLTEQVAECILGFEEAMDQKNLILDCDMDERIMVSADPELLTLVWNNLLSNAVKFTPQGGQITITVQAKDAYANVTVTDTGCGMDEKVGRHIFDKFYQGDTSHATEGNGLGLALVKRVVDLTEGEISVQSTLGQGSTFTVRFPRSQEHP